MWSEILAVGSYSESVMGLICISWVIQGLSRESRICLPCRTLLGVDSPAVCSLRLGLGVDGTCVMVAGSTVGGGGDCYLSIYHISLGRKMFRPSP